MPTVPGIDVSYWDSGIDWPKVRATGQRFVFVKATEGENYSDPTFKDNWAGAKSAGLLRGAYCFFHPNMDPKKQATLFINAVKATNDKGELPLVIDLEVADGVSSDKIIANVKIWLDLVEAAFGRKPIIYSGVSFLGTSFSIVGGGPPVWAKDYPLWLAWYPNQYTDGMTPLMPRGWYNWTFWQYSEKGTINGINAKADLDLFNGSLDDLYKFAGVQSPVQTPTTYTVTAGDSFETIANKSGVTVRELVAANPQLLKIGDKLTIPVPVAIPQDGGGAATTYTVKAGDTLTAIAIKFSVTIPAIVAANNLANPNAISVGQVLTIPKSS